MKSFLLAIGVILICFIGVATFSSLLADGSHAPHLTLTETREMDEGLLQIYMLENPTSQLMVMEIQCNNTVGIADLDSPGIGWVLPNSKNFLSVLINPLKVNDNKKSQCRIVKWVKWN